MRSTIRRADAQESQQNMCKGTKKREGRFFKRHVVYIHKYVRTLTTNNTITKTTLRCQVAVRQSIAVRLTCPLVLKGTTAFGFEQQKHKSRLHSCRNFFDTAKNR